MRLLYIVPGEGLSPEEMERRRRVLQEYAFCGTEVSITGCKNGVASIESNYEDALVTPSVIQAAVEAEKDGYDGIILGCAGDPGLYAVREMVHIPVVGPGENAVHLACMLGNRFSVVAIVDSCIPRHMHLVRRAGIISDKLASVRAAGIPVLHISDHLEEAKEHVSREARAAVEEDGADCIILGCLSLAFALFDRELSEKLGVPVVNPAISALKQLEAMVGSGMTHSKLAYRIPPKLRNG